MAVVYRDKYNRRVKKGTPGATRHSYSSTTGKTAPSRASTSKPADYTQPRPSSGLVSQPSVTVAPGAADTRMSTAYPEPPPMSMEVMSREPTFRELKWYEQGFDRDPETGEPTFNPPLEAQFPMMGGGVAIKGAKIVGGAGQKGLQALLRKYALATTPSNVGAKTTAGLVAVNTLTRKQTLSWLTRAYKAVAPRTPRGWVGLGVGVLAASAWTAGKLVDAIGTYPFAGFITEEAVQTTDFGFRTAMTSGNFTLAEEILDFREMMLDQEIEAELQGIPYKNILDKLDNYFEGARLKLEADRQYREQEMFKIENNMTDAEMWERIRAENEQRIIDERAATEAYYENVRRLQEEAKRAGRAADEAYWAQIYAEREAAAEAKRLADEAYWTAYWKNVNKIREESAPSKLGFGLI